MIELLLKFTLAHLIGDFLLQPDNWVEEKRKKKIKSKFLFIHAFIHFLLLLIFIGFNSEYLIGIIVISFSHLLIDCIKLYTEKKKFSKIFFFADQFLHFLTIIAVVNYYFPIDLNLSNIFTNEILLLLISSITITYVTSIVLKVVLRDLNPNKENPQTNSAGKYIGILERLFVFLFIVINFWEGIGFLLAAKSIFRFGDLKENKDIRLTEYILIGTLLSFGIGIAVSLSYLHLLDLISISSTN